MEPTLALMERTNPEKVKELRGLWKELESGVRYFIELSEDELRKLLFNQILER